MFSYSKAIQEVTTEAVFARGIKYFLFKKIKSKRNLSLNNWREYEVRGEKEIYRVRIPVVHLIQNVADNQDLGSILEEFAQCNCAYFQDFGICKHIAAVCADLDDEFELSHAKKKVEQKITQNHLQSNLLDKIFGAHQSRKHQEYTTYLFKENAPSLLSRDMVYELEDELQSNGFSSEIQPDYLIFEEQLFNQEISDDPQINNENLENWYKSKIPDYGRSLLGLLNQSILPCLGYYKEEKKVLILLDKITPFWRYPQSLSICLNWAKCMTPENQARVHYLLYRLAFTGMASSFWTDQYLRFLSNVPLSPAVSERVMELLVETFSSTALITVNFAFLGKNEDWFRENLDELDNNFLTKAIRVLPDEFERIDLNLKNRAWTWIEYLQADTKEYENLSQFLHDWNENLGLTENLQETLSYIKQLHAKKKGLLKMIGDIA
ncbi:MAG: hypothetical protein OHK0017_06990 [Patescibacteria group bacterium]